jgi:hypothetical protein
MTIIKNHFEVFLVTSKKQGNDIIESIRARFPGPLWFRGTVGLYLNVKDCVIMTVVSQNSRVRERQFVTAIDYLPLATTFLRFQIM